MSGVEDGIARLQANLDRTRHFSEQGMRDLYLLMQGEVDEAERRARRAERALERTRQRVQRQHQMAKRARRRARRAEAAAAAASGHKAPFAAQHILSSLARPARKIVDATRGRPRDT